MVLALFICVKVALNPGPKNTKYSYKFSLCHRNLSNLPAQDFFKLSLIKTNYTHHNLDMMCLCETSFENDYPRLNLKDYTLVRADNLYSCKPCGVSIYLKEHLVFCPVSAHNRNE